MFAINNNTVAVCRDAHSQLLMTLKTLSFHPRLFVVSSFFFLLNLSKCVIYHFTRRSRWKCIVFQRFFTLVSKLSLFFFCFFYFFLIRGGNAAKLFERVATLRSIINLLYISLCKTKCFVQNLAGIEDFFWLYRVTSDSTLHTFKEGGIFEKEKKQKQLRGRLNRCRRNRKDVTRMKSSLVAHIQRAFFFVFIDVTTQIFDWGAPVCPAAVRCLSVGPGCVNDADSNEREKSNRLRASYANNTSTNTHTHTYIHIYSWAKQAKKGKNRFWVYIYYKAVRLFFFHVSLSIFSFLG